MTIASNYNASGLSSGIDWVSMVDKLVTLESAPLNTMKQQQQDLSTQVSTLGSLASKLSALKSAVDDLAKAGALAVTTAGANDSFTAQPGSAASAGRYSVEVDALAQAAKSRSASFAPTDSLAGGTLALTAMGKPYTVNMTDGESLADVATAIRDTGAPITATVLNDGTNDILVLTSRDTGFPIGSDPSQALSVVETTTGTGKALGFTALQAAQNASIKVDGIALTRTTNVIADAVPGTSLTLTSAPAVAEDLVLNNDVSGTAAKIKQFTDAYNDVIKLVQSQLDVTQDTDRNSTLAGDLAVRGLQGELQGMLVASNGLSDVRTLADIGIETARDGTISVNSDTLASALTRDPAALDGLFTDPTTGLGTRMDALVDGYTNSVDGLLVQEQSTLNAHITDLTNREADEQTRLDDYRAGLIAQFTAMEDTISNLKAVGNYLDQQAAQKASSS
jgi:flagellar hook-associated protein 2